VGLGGTRPDQRTQGEGNDLLFLRQSLLDLASVQVPKAYTTLNQALLCVGDTLAQRKFLGLMSAYPPVHCSFNHPPCHVVSRCVCKLKPPLSCGGVLQLWATIGHSFLPPAGATSISTRMKTYYDSAIGPMDEVRGGPQSGPWPRTTVQSGPWFSQGHGSVRAMAQSWTRPS
jgi:hypothetical protein